jgi:hypothetical protein
VFFFPQNNTGEENEAKGVIPMNVYKKPEHNHSTVEEVEKGEKYACVLCGYESDMKHYEEWQGMCYQCYIGETKGGW